MRQVFKKVSVRQKIGVSTPRPPRLAVVKIGLTLIPCRFPEERGASSFRSDPPSSTTKPCAHGFLLLLRAGPRTGRTRCRPLEGACSRQYCPRRVF